VDDWMRAAPAAASRAVLDAARGAMDDWRARVSDAAERIDLEPHCLPRPLDTSRAVQAAGQAAGEVQVIALVWPARLDTVLRSGRSARPAR
jgi:hypothetical protein